MFFRIQILNHLFQRLTAGAIVDGTAQISLLHDRSAANRARLRAGVARKLYGISARFPEEVLLGIAPAAVGHLPQHAFQRPEKPLRIGIPQRGEFAFRMNPRPEQNILQNSVPEPRNPLFRGQECLCREVLLRRGPKPAEITGVEPLLQR